jgi:hypothetical protein
MSDPFSAHRHEAVHAQTAAEATTVEPPAELKPVENEPPADAKPAVEKPAPTVGAGSPFGQHKVEPKAHPAPERTRKPAPPPKLLHDWLRHNWRKPDISLRDLQTFGPYDIRDRKSAIAYAETLESYGWLVEIRAHRRDRRVWRLPPAAVTN